MKKSLLFYLPVSIVFFISACGPMHRLSKDEQSFLRDDAVKHAHIGISIYDVAKQQYVYDHQGDHYFTPASNTKLFTCYAAMKYLGDSITGLRFYETADTLFILPTADPSLLYRDFNQHPVISFLEKNKKPVSVSDAYWKENRWGKGWSWDDYMDDYMAERSPMPIYGNIAKTSVTYRNGSAGYTLQQVPAITAAVTCLYDATASKLLVKRAVETDSFTIRYNAPGLSWQSSLPFTTHGLASTATLLGHGRWTVTHQQPAIAPGEYQLLKSQPLDSILKPMMYRSDNFYAEQVLLMVSDAVLGYMNDAAMIDTLLKTDLNDLPQPAYWVDGSGLSRYNLFTPQDFITLLLKLKNEFGINRLRNILPKGNTGTLGSRYQQIGNDIFGKTGTLTGQVAFSGFLICRSKKMLVFSVLVNNHHSSAAAVRKAVEHYLEAVWEKY